MYVLENKADLQIKILTSLLIKNFKSYLEGLNPYDYIFLKEFIAGDRVNALTIKVN